MIKIYPKVLGKSTMLKNIKKINASLPIMDRPIAGYLNLQFEPIANPILNNLINRCCTESSFYVNTIF